MSDDVWRNVSVVESTGPPAVTEPAGAVVDRDGRKLAVLFGGWKGAEAECSNELWAYDIATRVWEPLEALGDPPSARCAHAMASVSTEAGPFSAALTLFGGEDTQHTLLNDTWVLAPNADGQWEWQALPTQAATPSPRRGAVMEAISDGRAILFGGMDGTQRLNDLHLLADNVWRPIEATGLAPSPRDAHAVAYNPKEHCLHLFGGFDVADAGDRHALMISEAEGGGSPACEWVLEPSGKSEPCARSGHSLVCLPDQAALVLMLGAQRGAITSECADVAEYSFAESAWCCRLFQGEHPLQPRTSHVAFSVDSRAIIYGGRSGTEYLRSTVEVEFAKPADAPSGKKK